MGAPAAAVCQVQKVMAQTRIAEPVECLLVTTGRRGSGAPARRFARGWP